MASKLKSTQEFKDAMEAVFTLLSEDPEMGPALRDADVPQRFDFDDVDLVLNARARGPASPATSTGSGARTSPGSRRSA